MKTLLTFGYLGRSVAELEAIAEELDAVVADVRHRPWSRWSEWNRSTLERRFGRRYQHVAGFGNLRWRESAADAVELADPDAGVAQVTALLTERPVILLCMCKDAEACHRRVAARLVAEHSGCSVQHLGPEGSTVQLPLW